MNAITIHKLAAVAKSPLTGLISDGLSSSHFAIAGKRMGVDAIVLVGRCAEPSELIGDALRRSEGNQAQAARNLGLSYHQFRYYHKKYVKASRVSD